MNAASNRRSGFLVLADISGYTVFLTENELEHAQEIIEDLTHSILGALTPALTFVKLEGDAIFAHAADGRLSGDLVLDLIERVYGEFSDRRDDMKRQTRCTCTACTNIATLDLKFVAHHGEYVVHRAGGTEDLAGPDVILVHRLLKNRVRETLQCQAYALLTRAAIEEIGEVRLVGHVEHSDEFGDIEGGVLDLGAALRRLREQRRVFLDPRDCEFSYRMRLPVPPAEAWEWWTDPGRVPQWQYDVLGQRLERNASGRQGAEATMHCAHGSYDTVARYLDWRPFHYYTAERIPSGRALSAPPAMIETVEFQANGDGGTDVEYRSQSKDRRVLARLLLRMMSPVGRRSFARYERDLTALIAKQRAADHEDAVLAAEV